jgi:hypothetical protein
MPSTGAIMLPDYIIYDELKRERDEDGPGRPRIEVPTPPSDSEFERPDESDAEESSDHSDDRPDDQPDRGVTIISL